MIDFLNLYLTAFFQGSILIGILKFDRIGIEDGLLDLYIVLYIASVLGGVGVTVWLYWERWVTLLKSCSSAKLFT